MNWDCDHNLRSNLTLLPAAWSSGRHGWKAWSIACWAARPPRGGGASGGPPIPPARLRPQRAPGAAAALNHPATFFYSFLLFTYSDDASLNMPQTEMIDVPPAAAQVVVLLLTRAARFDSPIRRQVKHAADSKSMHHHFQSVPFILTDTP